MARGRNIDAANRRISWRIRGDELAGVSTIATAEHGHVESRVGLADYRDVQVPSVVKARRAGTGRLRSEFVAEGIAHDSSVGRRRLRLGRPPGSDSESPDCPIAVTLRPVTVPTGNPSTVTRDFSIPKC